MPLASARETSPSVRARLRRDIPVQLVNVSRSGFLLECHQSILEGTPGELHLSASGAPAHDPVHISRAVTREGCRTPVLLGGEFSDDAPVATSVRAIVPAERDARPRSDTAQWRRWRKNDKSRARHNARSRTP